MSVTDNQKQNFSFSKSQRLLKAEDFKPVFDKPSFKIHQANILFFVKVQNDCEGEKTGQSRLGLAITKKKNKRANERNRVKRLMRERFRLCQHQFEQAVDVVGIVKTTTTALDNEALAGQIEMGFQQIIGKMQKISQSSSIAGL